MEITRSKKLYVLILCTQFLGSVAIAQAGERFSITVPDGTTKIAKTAALGINAGVMTALMGMYTFSGFESGSTSSFRLRFSGLSCGSILGYGAYRQGNYAYKTFMNERIEHDKRPWVTTATLPFSVISTGALALCAASMLGKQQFQRPIVPVVGGLAASYGAYFQGNDVAQEVHEKIG